MVDFEHMVLRQRRWMLYLLGVFLIAAFVTPYKSIFLGLLLGHVVSYYSLRLLHRNINRFGEAVIEQGSTIGLGTFLRLIGAGLAIFIALKFEEEFHIIAVVFGLITSYIVMMVEFFVRAIADSKK